MAEEAIPEGFTAEEWAQVSRDVQMLSAVEQYAVLCECPTCQREREWKVAVSRQQYEPEGLRRWMEEANRRLGEERYGGE